jgi:voltage-gated potassium channel
MNEESSVEKLKQNQDVVDRHSTVYNLFILGLTLFSLMVVAGLVTTRVSGSSNAVLWRVDFFICIVFFVDFLVNLWRAPDRTDYLFKQGGWLDLLGAIPVVSGVPWTPFLRLARLNRLVRIVKHLRGKDRRKVLEETRQSPAKTVLLTMTIAAFVLITVASLSILTLERGAGQANIKTGANAFWWAFVTVTTVGYGDYTPVTFPGRVLAMILMTFGIGIFAVLTSFAWTRVVVSRAGEEDTIAIVKEENAIIRAELAEIKELLKQQGSMTAPGGDHETVAPAPIENTLDHRPVGSPEPVRPEGKRSG